MVVIFAQGCKKGSPTITAPKNYTEIVQMTLEEQKAFDRGTYALVVGAVYIWDSTPETPFFKNFPVEGWSFRTTLLRNPGGMIYVVKKRNGNVLSDADRTLLAQMAKEANVDILPDGRIPYRFGPDHRTPIVMASNMEYIPESYAKVVPISVFLSFKDAKTAKLAAEYVDASTYKATAKGSKLSLSFKAPLGSVTDEQDAFIRLAERFGGKFEWSEASREE